MWPIVTDQVAWSVGLSVTLVSHAKNGCTNRDAVWVDNSGGPKEPCIRWGPDPPWEGAILRGKGRSSVQKRLNRLRCCLGCGPGWAQRIMLDGGPTVLRDVAMATNFVKQFAITGLRPITLVV